MKRHYPFPSMFCVQDDYDASQDLDHNVLSAQEPTTRRSAFCEQKIIGEEKSIIPPMNKSIGYKAICQQRSRWQSVAGGCDIYYAFGKGISSAFVSS